jgi:hypothetical protein
MVRACALAVLIALTSAATALAADPVFTPQLRLPSSPPDGQLTGAEPSVGYDPTGDGHVYVDAPRGLGGGTSFWASADGGDTWPIAKSIGSKAGGGDTDVEVGIDHTVYVPDLEGAANAICRSHDFGKTFTDGCEEGDGGASDQTGPESDRPWMAKDPRNPKVVYFVYHDLAGGTLIAERSDDGGQTWGPCGNMLEPGSQAQLEFTPGAGGTGLSKPAVGPDGTLYVSFLEPSSRGASTNLDSFFVAIAKGGCTATTQWHDVTIHLDPGADLGHFWPTVATDAAGGVYAGAAGKATSADQGYQMYLWASKDQGETWTKPIRVNTPDLKSNVLPGIAGGLRAGQVTAGWYGTSDSSDATAADAHWRYYAAESFDYGQHFVQIPLSGPDIHAGPICTLGTLCTSGRDLLDFTSVAIDPRSGCPAFIFGGDSSGPGSAVSPFFSRQVGGQCLTAPVPPAPSGPPGTTPVPATTRAPTLGLPSSRRCLSRRVFRIRLRAPKGETLARATVTVAGHRARVTRRRGRLTAVVDLRRARKGAFVVRVRAITRSGRRVSEQRRYHTCR